MHAYMICMYEYMNIEMTARLQTSLEKKRTRS
jgi:hypothetical protein